MTPIIVRESWPRMTEVWFDEPIHPSDADVAVLRQHSRPDHHANSERFPTLLIDLRQTEATIMSGFNSDTRYKARRALDRDGVVVESISQPSPEGLLEFLTFLHDAQRTKGLSQESGRVLQRLAKADALQLSRATLDGEAVVWHSYVVRHGRARLLHSASLFRAEASSDRRAQIGRANRGLHWSDMRHFRAQGLHTYDLGGRYEGTTNAELLDVNRFKDGFGGNLVTEFNARVALTSVGRLYLAAKRYLRRH